MAVTAIINSKPPAPLWLRELASARTSYEEELGWPAHMEVTHRRLTVEVGGVLAAVSMPVPLGSDVLAELRLMMLTGPVLVSPGDRWTFLTAAPAHSSPVLCPSLGAAGVRNVPHGTTIVLPCDLGSVEWIVEPSRSLPPWYTVVGAARRVLG
ncbi:hypothetical protein Lesp02_12020 [Lentzea sp. NBRC 105346]|uniref:hypothetical protein n=1 Tax=Lentzea sp. NBRC 105346 TaxID=3032205 RepID=UPI0024A39176|nr:hypothetical protein [Lentzea sp. NBRC 105346]GLZ29012.1 hypothetical protein Lesp02_12020 [Lentzea sp. NBRC 105346]